MDIKERRHRIYLRRDELIKSGLTVSEALTQAWAEDKKQDNSNKQVKPTPPPTPKVAEKQIPYNVTNSARTEFEDKYPPTNRTEDGHWVRSRAEVNIDNWLYFHGIVHAYEMKLPGTNYRCDFYIPMGKVYIEFWGLDEAKYLAKRLLKLEIYNNEKLILIELFDKDEARLGDVLPDKLREYHVPVL